MKDNLDLINAYLRGNLTNDEMIDFDNRLKNDLDFQVEFQAMKLIRDRVREGVKSQVLLSLKKQEDSIQKRQITKTHTTMRKYTSIAASLVLIVSLSYFGFSKGTNNIDGSQIFDEYYQSYANLASGTVRGTKADLENLKAKAYYAYDLGNYTEAADRLTQLLMTEKNAANYFYLGMAQIENGDNETAIHNLNTVFNNYKEYTEQAQWFLALTLLKQGEENQALSNLIDLSLNGQSYKDKSSEILKNFGLSFLEDGPGHVIVVEVITRPDDEEEEYDTHNVPDGSKEGQRRYQFGEVQNQKSGEIYEFFNDRPLKGLKEGDMVKCYIITKSKKDKKGYAFLLD